MIEIYFVEDNDLINFEAISKGYRNDVYVKVNDKFYKTAVYSIVRLGQDFASESKAYGYYSIEPNLILVNDVEKKEIVYTIEKLNTQRYFDYLKPLDSEGIEGLELIKIN